MNLLLMKISGGDNSYGRERGGKKENKIKTNNFLFLMKVILENNKIN